MVRMRIFLAAAIAFALVAEPGFAQNPCRDALKQVEQNRSTIALNYQNAEQKLATDRTNALLECEKQAVPGGAGAAAALAACDKQVGTAYAEADISLQQAANTAFGAAQQVANDIARGPTCTWSPAEITQFVSQVGQTAAKLAQSAAQIITAAKGKASAPAAASTASAGTTPASTAAAAAPSKPTVSGGPPPTTPTANP